VQLFRKMINNEEHCIHQLLPPEKIIPMKLRASNCIFSLPQCHYNLHKRSFVVRRLFEDAYYYCYSYSMAFDRCLIKDYLLTYLLSSAGIRNISQTLASNSLQLNDGI